MSTEPQRYELDELSDVSPSDDGNYVLFSEYEALRTELLESHAFAKELTERYLMVVKRLRDKIECLQETFTKVEKYR